MSEPASAPDPALPIGPTPAPVSNSAEAEIKAATKSALYSARATIIVGICVLLGTIGTGIATYKSSQTAIEEINTTFQNNQIADLAQLRREAYVSFISQADAFRTDPGITEESALMTEEAKAVLAAGPTVGDDVRNMFLVLTDPGAYFDRYPDEGERGPNMNEKAETAYRKLREKFLLDAANEVLPPAS